jgi:uncharacterized membrane protein YkoI
MSRSAASPRPALRSTLAVSAFTAIAAAGIGLGAYSLGSASDAATPQGSPAARQTTAEAPSTPGQAAPVTAPATGPAMPTTSAALTLEEAKAVATRAAAAPGRVVEWHADDEPTGLRYDVTLLHGDGSTTDIEVDTVTGRVTSLKHDDNRD